MTPNFSLLPQALSVQPATTSPKGDEAEKADWIKDPIVAAKGKVFVYDVPLAVAKKDLIEHPEKVRALYPNLVDQAPEQFSPEAILEMDHNSDLYRSYQDMTW